MILLLLLLSNAAFAGTGYTDIPACFGVYNPVPPVLSSGQESTFQMDINGNLLVNCPNCSGSGGGTVTQGPGGNPASPWFVSLVSPSPVPIAFPTPYPTVPVTGNFFQATQPVSFSTPVPVSFPSPYPTVPVTIPTPLPVTIPTPVPVTGTFFQTTQPVSFATPVPIAFPTPYPTVPVTIPTPVPVTGTFFQTTQPVSFATPVPISFPTPYPTVPVTVSTPLPVSQSTTPWVDNLTQVGGSPISLGQQSVANSLPVVTQPDVTPATQNISAADVASTSTVVANTQTFVTGTPTAGSAASFSVPSYNTVQILVTGTWVATLVTEISMDGGTTWTTRGIKLSGAPFRGSSFTANFQGDMNVAGITNMRVRATSYTSGTPTIKIVQSINKEAVEISSLPLPLDGFGSGTIAGAGQSVSISTNGCSTLSFTTTGTWTAAMIVVGTVAGTGVNLIPAYSQTGVPIAPGGVFTANNTFQVSCAGFDHVIIEPFLFTSGTMSVAYQSSAGISNFPSPLSYFSFKNLTGVGTTTVKTGAGVLHSICYNTASTGAFTAYDNTAASGTIIASPAQQFTTVVGAAFVWSPNCQLFDANFATGLTVNVSAAGNWTFNYK